MFTRQTAAVFLSAAIAVVGAAACGSNGGSGGGGGTGPTPLITSIALTPTTDFLLRGETLQLSGTAAYSNGTTGAASGTWGSDAPSVATVDSAGKVTAVNSGKATVWLEMQGVRGTRLFTVHPNFRGGWSGIFVVRSCVHSGDFATGDFCKDMAGGTDSIKLQVNQDRTSVSGTIDLGGFPSSHTGSVRDDGTMVLDATVPVGAATVRLKNWSTRSEIAGSMTGGFTLEWTAPPLAGSSEWVCELSGMTKTSGALQALGMPVGAGGVVRAKAGSVIR